MQRRTSIPGEGPELRPARAGAPLEPVTAYCVITEKTDDAGDVRYQVWRRATGDRRAELVGAFTHLETARRSLPVLWHEARSEGLVAWSFLES